MLFNPLFIGLQNNQILSDAPNDLKNKVKGLGVMFGDILNSSSNEAANKTGGEQLPAELKSLLNDPEIVTNLQVILISDKTSGKGLVAGNTKLQNVNTTSLNNLKEIGINTDVIPDDVVNNPELLLKFLETKNVSASDGLILKIPSETGIKHILVTDSSNKQNSTNLTDLIKKLTGSQILSDSEKEVLAAKLNVNGFINISTDSVNSDIKEVTLISVPKLLMNLKEIIVKSAGSKEVSKGVSDSENVDIEPELPLKSQTTNSNSRETQPLAESDSNLYYKMVNAGVPVTAENADIIITSAKVESSSIDVASEDENSNVIKNVYNSGVNVKNGNEVNKHTANPDLSKTSDNPSEEVITSVKSNTDSVPKIQNSDVEAAIEDKSSQKTNPGNTPQAERTIQVSPGASDTQKTDEQPKASTVSASIKSESTSSEWTGNNPVQKTVNNSTNQTSSGNQSTVIETDKNTIIDSQTKSGNYSANSGSVTKEPTGNSIVETPSKETDNSTEIKQTQSNQIKQSNVGTGLKENPELEKTEIKVQNETNIPVSKNVNVTGTTDKVTNQPVENSEKVELKVTSTKPNIPVGHPVSQNNESTEVKAESKVQNGIVDESTDKKVKKQIRNNPGTLTKDSAISNPGIQTDKDGENIVAKVEIDTKENKPNSINLTANDGKNIETTVKVATNESPGKEATANSTQTTVLNNQQKSGTANGESSAVKPEIKATPEVTKSGDVVIEGKNAASVSSNTNVLTESNKSTYKSASQNQIESPVDKSSVQSNNIKSENSNISVNTNDPNSTNKVSGQQANPEIANNTKNVEVSKIEVAQSDKTEKNVKVDLENQNPDKKIFNQKVNIEQENTTAKTKLTDHESTQNVKDKSTALVEALGKRVNSFKGLLQTKEIEQQNSKIVSGNIRFKNQNLQNVSSTGRTITPVNNNGDNNIKNILGSLTHIGNRQNTYTTSDFKSLAQSFSDRIMSKPVNAESDVKINLKNISQYSNIDKLFDAKQNANVKETIEIQNNSKNSNVDLAKPEANTKSPELNKISNEVEFTGKNDTNIKNSSVKPSITENQRELQSVNKPANTVEITERELLKVIKSETGTNLAQKLENAVSGEKNGKVEITYKPVNENQKTETTNPDSSTVKSSHSITDKSGIKARENMNAERIQHIDIDKLNNSTKETSVINNYSSQSKIDVDVKELFNLLEKTTDKTLLGQLQKMTGTQTGGRFEIKFVDSEKQVSMTETQKTHAGVEKREVNTPNEKVTGYFDTFSSREEQQLTANGDSGKQGFNQQKQEKETYPQSSENKVEFKESFRFDGPSPATRANVKNDEPKPVHTETKADYSSSTTNTENASTKDSNVAFIKDSEDNFENVKDFFSINDNKISSDSIKSSSIFASDEPVKHVKVKNLMHEISKFFEQKYNNSITFSITPEHLGKVKVSLKLVHDVLKASIEVENEQVKQIVESNMGALKNTLMMNGLTSGDINVMVSNQHSKQGKYFQNQKRKERAFADDNESFDSKQLADTPLINRKYGYNTYEYTA